MSWWLAAASRCGGVGCWVMIWVVGCVGGGWWWLCSVVGLFRVVLGFIFALGLVFLFQVFLVVRAAVARCFGRWWQLCRWSQRRECWWVGGCRVLAASGACCSVDDGFMGSVGGLRRLDLVWPACCWGWRVWFLCGGVAAMAFRGPSSELRRGFSGAAIGTNYPGSWSGSCEFPVGGGWRACGGSVCWCSRLGSGSEGDLWVD